MILHVVCLSTDIETISETEGSIMQKYHNKEWLTHQYENLDKTISEIADMCDTSAGTISPYMQAYGLTSTISDEEIKKYNNRAWLTRKMAVQGKTTKELSEETGIHRKVFGIWKGKNNVVTSAQKIIEGRKLCSKCGNWKPLKEFGKQISTKSGYKSRCKECMRTKDSLEKKRKYQQKFREENPQYAIHHTIGAGIWESLKEGKARKGWEEILPYNFEDLKKHLQKQFKDGMSFDNYGDWHIDHIKPKSNFDINGIDDPKLQKCWALENLQPLWAEENLRKGDKDPSTVDFASETS